MKKNKMGFEDPDDEFSSAGMYFNQSVFPPHRPEKDVCVVIFSYFKLKSLCIVFPICLKTIKISIKVTEHLAQYFWLLLKISLEKSQNPINL